MPTKKAVAETYEEVKKLIYKIVHRHSRDKDEFEELLGFANLQFMQIYEKYDYTLNDSFSAFLSNQLNYRIIDYHRQRQREHSTFVYIEHIESVMPLHDEFHGRMEELLAKMPVNAQTVAELILEEDEEFQLYLRIHKTHTRTRFKRALKDYLEDYEWPREEILQTFEDLTDFLNEN